MRKLFAKLMAFVSNIFTRKKIDQSHRIFSTLGLGDIAIDCGANVGNVTEVMAMHGAMVYAFEPNPHAYKALKSRFEGRMNVHCLNQGVWKEPGKLRLHMHENAESDQIHWSTGSSFLDYKTNVQKDRFWEVNVVDLAAFIRGLEKPVKILKMDIEGAECEVLTHIMDTGLHREIECILVETHDHKVPELIDATNRIRRRVKEESIQNIDLDWI